MKRHSLQAGTAAVALCGVSALLLSACATREAQPEPLSHFKCYVADGRPIGLEERLSLEDQFHLEKGVEVVSVRYFCNPVTKIREGKPHPANLNEDHLTCYQIRGDQRFWAKVDAENQFGRTQLDVRNDELLCVPTAKRSFEPVPPGTEECPGGLHCCCNLIDTEVWPDCDTGFVCRSNRNVAGPGEDINVCVPRGSPANYPIQLHPSQPPFCRRP